MQIQNTNQIQNEYNEKATVQHDYKTDTNIQIVFVFVFNLYFVYICLHVDLHFIWILFCF